MPIHDWTRVPEGIFHDFHLEWIAAIKHQANRLLPRDDYALTERDIGDFGPDVLTLRRPEPPRPPRPDRMDDGGVATMAPPKARFNQSSDAAFMLARRRSVTIRHVSDDSLVAVVEIVSPGNKTGRRPFDALLDKSFDLLRRGIHLLLIDIFPPTKRDPGGLHAALGERIAEDDPFTPPPGQPLTFAAYQAGMEIAAFVEPAAVGEAAPTLPLILKPNAAVELPLAESYEAAWSGVPRRWQEELA